METLSFGLWVRNRRRALGLTQSDLAQQVACSTVTIRKIESDERRPSPHMAERLARFLEIPADEQEAFVRAARFEPTVEMVVGNLPANLAPLFGRAELIAQARNRLLRPGTRLLSLLGPGGVGKTSLALHLATSVGSAFSGGVFFVDLSPLTDPAQVLDAIAETIGAASSAHLPTEQRIRERIGTQRMLLLLDNLEQVVTVAALLEQVLAACPGLAILATSQVALGSTSEQRLNIPPLALPDEHAPHLEAPAIELFVARARSARANFQPLELPSIAAICRRLDGLPLAIELVAARVGLVEPPELLRRLDTTQGYGPLRLGHNRAPGAPNRQRTLVAALDWSVGLLPETERALLVHLGVCAGGCDLAAAEALAAGAGVEAAAVLDSLEHLVDASLLTRQTTADGATRFGLLNTVRDYALEHLHSEQESQARDQHAAFYTALAIEADQNITGPDQQAWFNRLELEHPNLRAALDWWLRTNPVRAAELGISLWWFWLSRSHWREGYVWLEQVLEQSEALLPPTMLAELCKGIATIGKELALHEAAKQRYLQALDLFHALGSSYSIATTLNNYAGMLHRQGDAAGALAAYEEALDRFREAKDDHAIAMMLGNIAVLNQEHGRPEEALRYHKASLERWYTLDNPAGLASALTNYGELAIYQNEPAHAMARYRESQELYQACGSTHGVTVTLNGMGMAAALAGNHAEALAFQLQVLPASQQLGDQTLLILGLEGSAHSLGALGRLDAARLYGLADHMRQHLNMPAPPAYAAFANSFRTAAAAQHPSRAWQAALRHGRTLTTDAAVALVEQAAE